MRSYGQFCPFALAAEVVGERWTPLILRELFCGRTRFNDIHRGIPRISPSLLTKRLKTLEKAGLVEHRRNGRGSEYRLTEAGRQLGPLIEQLAAWGKTWMPATLSRIAADADLIMWDLHRRLDLDRMPAERVVIRFDFADQPKSKRYRWIIANRDGAELCITDPGFEVDLFVTTDSRIITWVWYGDIPLQKAIADGRVRLDGPARLRAAFPSWLKLNELAPIPRRFPLRAA
jgi:DNA-binding HxlR family transcriptional regulator